MTEYSCKPAHEAGPGLFILTIDFPEPRWIQRVPGERVLPVTGIRGIYRPRALGRSEPPFFEMIEDPDHLLRAIADLESSALPTAEARARMWI